MSPEQFINKHRPRWERLSELLDLTEQRVGQLTQSQVAEIGRIYRATTSDLAIAQRDFPYHNVVSFLNQLVARAHATVYRGDPFTLRQIGRFFTHTMPQTFRETWQYFAAASLLFWLPFLIAAFVSANFPETISVLLPVGAEHVVSDIENHQPWFYFEGDDQASLSAMITTNNIRVAFMAFAGGMTAGFMTVVVLVMNGLMAGAVTGFAIFNSFFELTNFMIGHGVIELNIICLAGGAGLLFGWAIIRPGHLTRADALFIAGRKALILIIICALFLIVAGLIEGFISPREFLNPVVKWLVGLSSGSLMFAYLLLAGRKDT